MGDGGHVTPEDIEAYFAESAAVLAATAASCKRDILEIASLLTDAIRAGNKIMLCGNGGSAADAQHFAGELVGRFDKSVERPGLPAVALTTDTSFLTAYANDYGFSGVFARQVEALGRPGDVLVLISTSGNSPNLFAAAETATEQGVVTVGFLGGGGGELYSILDRCAVVPSDNPQHIQESHTAMMHFVAGFVEADLFAPSRASSSVASPAFASTVDERSLWDDIRDRLRHNTPPHGYFGTGRPRQ